MLFLLTRRIINEKRSRIIIGTVIIIGIVIGIFITLSFHKYDRITSKDTRILFFELSTYDYETYAVIAVDNNGTIYHTITEEDPFSIISNGAF